MTESNALNTATAFLDAFTAKDMEEAGTFLVDDFTFDGPIAHYRSAQDFLAGSQAFVDTILPGWKKIAAFGNEGEAVLLYDLAFLSRATMRIADYYTVENGKIQSESLLFDTHRLR